MKSFRICLKYERLENVYVRIHRHSAQRILPLLVYNVVPENIFTHPDYDGHWKIPRRGRGGLAGGPQKHSKKSVN